jgi:hypothetical protein
VTDSFKRIKQRLGASAVPAMLVLTCEDGALHASGACGELLGRSLYRREH